MDVIQISGGLDSLAVLFLRRWNWDDSVVMWVNTGAAHPDTLEWMEGISTLVPRFQMVQSNQPQNISQFGYPTDIVPVRATPLGIACHRDPAPAAWQSYLDCCGRNIWLPMHDATVALNPARVFRGQRGDDRKRAPISSGFVDEHGIEYIFPLENWTREQVWDYCERTCPEWIPAYYRRGEASSRDCWDCTAYLEDNIERIRALPPAQRGVVMQRLTDLRRTMNPDITALWEVLDTPIVKEVVNGH